MATGMINEMELELDDREDDAFIPSSSGSRSSQNRYPGRNGTLFGRLYYRIRLFLKALSTFKLVVLMLATFLVFLTILTYFKERPFSFQRVGIPSAFARLSKELVANLSGTVIPEYVLTYAPLVFLEKSEAFYPSDISTHLLNTRPTKNFTILRGAPAFLTPSNLGNLNALGDADIYLSSTESLIKMPKFTSGTRPSSKTLRTEGVVSCVVIVTEKEEKGVVDAFYMYFYSFDDGPTALFHKIGNHLGDWEHNLIRFRKGIPESIWYSQHEYGEAITYASANKIGVRPVAFSAKGSHANYPSAGTFDLSNNYPSIPRSIVSDIATPGRLWDPTLSAYFYTYISSPTTNYTLTPAIPLSPTSYLEFEGQWGDQEYGLGMAGQEDFIGYKKWTGGPRGPLDKGLWREEVCLPIRGRECIITSKLV